MDINVTLDQLISAMGGETPCFDIKYMNKDLISLELLDGSKRGEFSLQDICQDEDSKTSTIYDCLQEFNNSESLSGNNQYF